MRLNKASRCQFEALDVLPSDSLTFYHGGIISVLKPRLGTIGMLIMDVATAAQSQKTGAKMARKRKPSKYTPPSAPKTAMLFNVLDGTQRFPEERQFNLLKSVGADGERKDMRLYYEGDLSLLQEPCVAIVGTRNVSEAGGCRTRRLARELAANGVTVVSGLAKGVDSVAHRTAIEAGGKTIAVIGTPLEKAYPAANAPLQEIIYRDHLLISQFAPGERTFPSSFPQRNKLMAALSDATVIIEASDTSGTLHQAAECTRLDRWLFIAKSVIDDPSLSWPAKFLKYEKCVPLSDMGDILSRVLR